MDTQTQIIEATPRLGTSPFTAMIWTSAFVAIGLPQSHMPFITAVLSASYQQQKSTFDMADTWLVRYIPGDPMAASSRKQRTNHANYQRRRLNAWQQATGVELIAIRPGMATRAGLKIPTRYSIKFIEYLDELESSICIGQTEEEIRSEANRLARKFGWHRDQWKQQIKKEKPMKPLQDQLKTARTQAFGAITRIESLANDSTRDHLFAEIQRRLEAGTAIEPTGTPITDISPLDAIDALTESLREMVNALPSEEQSVARMRCAEKGIILTDDDEGDFDPERFAASLAQSFSRADNLGYTGHPDNFPAFFLDCNQTAGLIDSLPKLKEAIATQAQFCGSYLEAEDHILSAPSATEIPDTILSFGYTPRHNSSLMLGEWLAQDREPNLSSELLQ